jgi:hypothetical protein
MHVSLIDPLEPDLLLEVRRPEDDLPAGSYPGLARFRKRLKRDLDHDEFGFSLDPNRKRVSFLWHAVL